MVTSVDRGAERKILKRGGEIMENFGETLRKERVAKRVTLRKVSEYVDRSIGYLSDIENNRKGPPNLEIVRKIEELFCIDDGKLINLAAKLKRKVPKDVKQRIQMSPKLSEALLRADDDLTEEEFNDLMQYMDKIKKRRNR